MRTTCRLGLYLLLAVAPGALAAACIGDRSVEGSGGGPRAGSGSDDGWQEGEGLAITAERDAQLRESPSGGEGRACSVPAGTTLSLSEPPVLEALGVYRVELVAEAAAAIACDLDATYANGADFGLVAASVLEALEDASLRARAADEDALAPDELCPVPAGRLVELAAPPTGAEGGFEIVTLARPRPGCGLARGYLVGSEFRRVGTDEASGPGQRENPIDVPYFYQYDNDHEPGSTCGLTSAAMLLGASGRDVTPDDLYVRWGKPQGQSPEGLAAIFDRELGHGAWTRAGTRALIRRQIDAGRPVVLHTYFTSGHIVLVVGYDDEGFIFHDPAGRWAGCARCGYPGRTSTNGRYVTYPYEWLTGEVIGYDGDVWMSTGSTEPFSLW